MFSLFSASLKNPASLPLHLKIKPWKFILYILFLSVVSIIPGIVQMFGSNPTAEQYTNLIMYNLEKSNEDIDYTIKNNILASNNNKEEATIIKIDAFNYNDLLDNKPYNPSALPIYIIFNPCDKNELEISAPSIVVNLRSNEVVVYSTTPNFSDTNSLNAIEMHKSTYEKLNIGTVDFNDVRGFSTYRLEEKLIKAINDLLGSTLFFSSLANIPTLIFSSVISFLIEIGILAGISWVMLRRHEAKFFDLFKLVTFCMTPSVILGIYMLLPFGNIWYWIIYILSQIITIAYFYIAIKYYLLIYKK